MNSRKKKVLKIHNSQKYIYTILDKNLDQLYHSI